MSDWDLTEKRIYKLLRHPYQLDKSVVVFITIEQPKLIRNIRV